MQIPNLALTSGSAGQDPTFSGSFLVKGLSPAGLVSGAVLNGVVVSSDPTTTLLNLLDGRSVELAGDTGLAAGDEVALTVTAVRPQVQVRLATINLGTARAAVDLGLRDGQQVAARVLSRQPDGTVHLDVNGRVVNAAAPRDIEPGSLLPVQIQEDRGKLILTILHGSIGAEVLAQQFLRDRVQSRDSLGFALRGLAARLQGLLEGTGGSGAATQTLKGLHEILQKLELAPQPQPSSIEHALTDGGLFFEAHLGQALKNDEVPTGDLKAALLKASQEQSAADPELEQVIQETAAELERLQLNNVLTQYQENAIVWQLPGWNDSSPIALRIERDDETTSDNAEQQPAWQFLVSVELTQMGPVHVDARVQNDTVRAIFFVHQSQVETLDAALVELKADLSEDEFRNVWLAVRPHESIPAALQVKFRNTIDGSPARSQMVDIRG